jgi:hypothetical protein
MLAPALDKFSFVADPNQYKRIEIPFYRTGVAEGIFLWSRKVCSRGWVVYVCRC